MYHELSKREKKIARVIIDKGVDAEFTAGIEKAKQVIAEWENGGLTNRESYHKLYSPVKEHDKRISKRYDGLTGSRYLVTVAVILFDGQITEDDIKDFSDEAKQSIYSWIRFWKEDEEE
jgi:hypothetical protein